MTYLKMPLQLQSAVAKKLQRCSYQESIAQHIMLLILTMGKLSAEKTLVP